MFGVQESAASAYMAIFFTRVKFGTEFPGKLVVGEKLIGLVGFLGLDCGHCNSLYKPEKIIISQYKVIINQLIDA